MNAKLASRNTYFDFIRGIAICMVVAIHTVPALKFDNSILGTFEIIVRQALNAAVPIFLAISGFFLAKKPLSTKIEKLSFWKKQIPKVYIPCIIWSLPLFALSVYSGTIKSLPIDILNLLFCGFSIYYFIALIIQYYLLLPWLQPFKSKTVIIAGVISTISILSVNYLTKCFDVQLSLLLLAGPFPVWILFFVLGGGIYCSSRDYSLKSPIVVLLIGLVAQYFECQYLNELSNGGGFGIKLSAFIYSTALILILFSKKLENRYNPSNWFSRIVEKIGNLSFGIYLIHCYFITISSKIIPFHSWVTDFILVMLVSSTTILVSIRLLPSFSKKYLGF